MSDQTKQGVERQPADGQVNGAASPSTNGSSASAYPGDAWPVNILPHHRRQLEASGITAEAARQAGIYSEKDPRRVAQLLNWNNVAKQIRQMGPCLVFPFHDAKTGKVDPKYARLKPDAPRERKGKIVKYESPLGAPNRAYLPALARAAIDCPARFILITEGEKKALSACAYGLACVGLVGVYGFQKRRENKDGPRELIDDLADIVWADRPVYIVFDSDAEKNPLVQWAEWHLAELLLAKGAKVWVIRIPPGPVGPDGVAAKVGLDDYLVAHGEAAFQALLAAAAEAKPPEDRRPLIVWHADQHRPTYEVVSALAQDHRIYQRGGSLVKVIFKACAPDEADDSKPVIQPLSVSLLRLHITETCRLIGHPSAKKTPRKPAPDKKQEAGKPPEGQSGETREEGGKPALIHPPAELVGNVASLVYWPGIRPLTGVVQAPVLLRDGVVLQEPGYHRNSGLLYLPSAEYPRIPEKVTRDYALRCLELLLGVVRDFPFKSPCHKSAWLAGLLTMVARYAFRGNAPLFLVDANVPAAGKGLLIDVACLIATGSTAGKYANVTDDDEMRKLILGIAMSGDRAAVLDNVVGSFGCASLDAALTTRVFKGRRLGTNDNPEYQLMTTFWASGNNVVAVGDTARRCAHVRLESKEENPEEREDLHEKELLKYVGEHRAELLAAVLAILSGYIRAGRPRHDLKAWGSFEGWSALVRECVVWLGLVDPGEARLGREKSSDRNAEQLRGLMAAWKEVDRDGVGLTVAAFLEKVRGHPSLYPIASGVLTEMFGVNDKDWGKLSYKLRSFSGRVAAGEWFEGVEGHAGANRWRIHSDSPEGDQGGDSRSTETSFADGDHGGDGDDESPPASGTSAYQSVRPRGGNGPGSSPSSPWSPDPVFREREPGEEG